MFKSLFSLSDKIINNFNIFQNIIRLRKIKPKYLFFSENKNYQKYSYLIIETLVKKYPKEVYYVSSDSNDRIELPNINLGNNFSIMVDIKPNDNNGVGEIINIGGNFTLLVEPGSIFEVNILTINSSSSKGRKIFYIFFK